MQCFISIQLNKAFQTVFSCAAANHRKRLILVCFTTKKEQQLAIYCIYFSSTLFLNKASIRVHIILPIVYLHSNLHLILSIVNSQVYWKQCWKVCWVTSTLWVCQIWQSQRRRSHLLTQKKKRVIFSFTDDSWYWKYFTINALVIG